MSAATNSVSDCVVIDPLSPASKWRWMWWILAVGTLLFWLLATGIRCVLQDQSVLTATLFYASPVPVLLLVAVVSAESFRKLGKRRTAWTLLVLAVGQTLLWVPSAFQFRSETPPRDALRLVFWNVCRGFGGYPEMAREMLAHDPDLICVVEATGAGQREATWAEHLPGFKVYRLGSGMMVMVRGEIYGVEPGMIRDVARYRNMRFRIGAKRFGLCLIDIRSDPFVSRTPAFEALPEILDRFQKWPRLLVGDFNTPPDSTLFQSLLPEMTNAFAEKGSGYRETWPVFAPVLGLDQVWSSPEITVHACRHGWSLSSDHRPVIVEFSVTSP